MDVLKVLNAIPLTEVYSYFSSEGWPFSELSHLKRLGPFSSIQICLNHHSGAMNRVLTSTGVFVLQVNDTAALSIYTSTSECFSARCSANLTWTWKYYTENPTSGVMSNNSFTPYHCNPAIMQMFFWCFKGRCCLRRLSPVPKPSPESQDL